VQGNIAATAIPFQFGANFTKEFGQLVGNPIKHAVGPMMSGGGIGF
jgi:hypothetical protein